MENDFTFNLTPYPSGQKKELCCCCCFCDLVFGGVCLEYPSKYYPAELFILTNSPIWAQIGKFSLAEWIKNFQLAAVTLWNHLEIWSYFRSIFKNYITREKKVERRKEMQCLSLKKEICITHAPLLSGFSMPPCAIVEFNSITHSFDKINLFHKQVKCICVTLCRNKIYEALHDIRLQILFFFVYPSTPYSMK